jgi:formylglycine-generating enzyme required for sulfatase activity
MKQGKIGNPLGLSISGTVGIILLAGFILMVILGIIFRFDRLVLPPEGYQPMEAIDVQTRVSKVDGMEMVFVPAGSFPMGSTASDENAFQNEIPQHEVILDGFWIDRTEVTNRMYASCVDAGACELPWAYGYVQYRSITREDYFINAEFQDYPVIYISWYAAQAYCEWASRRLPTEAEWEKAARGTDTRLYPWGNKLVAGDLLNFADTNTDFNWSYHIINDGFEDTSPVGNYPLGASPYGALDMAGNVWEWNADWYGRDYYQESPRENPPGPAAGTHRVIRGGSWRDSNWGTRIAHRSRLSPDQALGYIGFRCALSEP